LAGWWHVLVSLPVLVALLLGWIWRYLLWAHLLWRISRFDLRLVATHPDRSAGLCFLGESLRAFSPVAMAVAIIAAGRSANIVLGGGALPAPNAIANAILLGGLVILFIAPLTIFAQNLFNVWHRAVFSYGALATRVGVAFENKWLRDRRGDSEAILEKPDFSATTDLYSIVANVYALRFVPLDLNSAIAICIAVLLPFVPVVLLAFPMATIWSHIKSLLF
jgi:hypothetical protein